MTKATFIRSVGGCRLNGLGAYLYENPDMSASIRFDKNTHPLPSKFNMVFHSLDAAENFIELNSGSNGASTLNNILRLSDINWDS